MPSLRTLKLTAINVLVALLLGCLLIDTLPVFPSVWQANLQPHLQRLGLNQGAWNMFTPHPDSINLRLRAEVTYRDGEQRLWRSPDWRSQSLWQRWVGHRRQEFCDMIVNDTSIPAWESWARHLARSLRPDFAQAERGAKVRIVIEQATIPPADQRPWPTWREQLPYDDAWTMTIKKFPGL